MDIELADLIFDMDSKIKNRTTENIQTTPIH